MDYDEIVLSVHFKTHRSYSGLRLWHLYIHPFAITVTSDQFVHHTVFIVLYLCPAAALDVAVLLSRLC